MRIVHVSDTFAPLMGGMEAQVARLAARQAAAGHEVEVITTTPGAPGERGVTTAVERLGAFDSAAVGSGVDDSGSDSDADGARDDVAGSAAAVPDVTVHRIAARVPGGWPIHPRSTSHVVRRLRMAMASGARPDVVHLHMGVLAPTVQAALGPITRLGLPAVLTVHSVWGPAWRAFAAADAMTRWSRWPVQWSAVSELTAAPLRRIVGTRGEVLVLPNGLDLAEWRPVRHRDAEGRHSRDTEGTRNAGEPGAAGGTGNVHETGTVGPAGGSGPGAAPGGSPFEGFRTSGLHLVSAGRFAPRKRMLPLLASAARAYEVLARGRLRVTLAGDGAELTRARRFVVEHGLSDVVSLPGALGADGLRELYAGADVFAAPAVAEAFGIAALEAQAAGLAVLTRAGSGVAERVSSGVDGLIVPDDAALARALVRLATDGDLLHRLLERSRDDTRLAAYAWPGVLAATERAYARAIELALVR
ncbi:glycosyltransferase family 4 protein [Myceligenerans halotolerans]